jgi:hypothetical protein
MHRSKPIFSILLLSAFVLISNLPANAQGDPRPQQPETSYDVVLQIVIGGDDKATTPLPQSLVNITKQLKANYPYSDYKLANTYVGRIGTNGNLENKSISNVFGQTQPPTDTPTFWEWSISTLRSPSTGNNLMMNGFRFGARVPVRTGSARDGSGGVQPIFNYENIGLTSGRLNVPENTPTLIGSLALPNSTGTAFLVLTLRPV